MAEASQGATASNYEKQHPRINKPDMFMNTALLMERSPQAERPNSFVPETSTQEVRDGQSGDPNHLSDGERPLGQETVRRVQIEPRKCNKSGAVVVLPNDRALSVDCSQEGVHAAVSALNKFGQEKAKGCQVYLSRRPCSYCAKLLVQCEVAKVYYLPIEPELNDKEDVQRVDKLFKASSAGLSVFIPKVSDTVIEGVIKRTSPFLGGAEKRNAVAIKDCKRELIKEYWSDEWVKKARNDLEWPAFDANMQGQTQKDMYNLMEWIARATVGDVPSGVFLEINPTTLKGVYFKTAGPQDTAESREPREAQEDNQSGSKAASALNKPVVQESERKRSGMKQDDGQSGHKDASTQKKPVDQESQSLSTVNFESSQSTPIPSIPTPNEPSWQRHALHMVRIAQMLSQRSDDPSKPVGCILMVHGEVVAIGWNGFPAKALYGEFPRASTADQAREKKEPYVIHAEQNALLTRNKRNMKHESSILYSNKVPCGECVPLLIQAGVKNVVVPYEPLMNDPDNRAFLTALRKEKLKGYWPARQEETAKKALFPSSGS